MTLDVNLVLGQYRGARKDADEDEISPIQGMSRGAFYTVAELAPQRVARHPLYPNLGAADAHDACGGDSDKEDFLDK